MKTKIISFFLRNFESVVVGDHNVVAVLVDDVIVVVLLIS